MISTQQKENLVLLPGLAMPSSVWHHLLPALHTHFNVIALDLPGFGDNDITLKPYDINTVVTYILSVTPQRAIWLGWSLGGLLAMQIALQAPERVTRLITVTSSPKFVKTDDWPGREESLLTQFANELSTDYQTTLKQFFALQFYGLPGDAMEKWYQQIANSPTPDKSAIAGSIKILQDTDLRAQLNNIHCPFLQMFGRLDRIVPIASAAKNKLLNPRMQQFIFPHASHAPFLSNENQFMEVLLHFITSNLYDQ